MDTPDSIDLHLILPGLLELEPLARDFASHALGLAGFEGEEHGRLLDAFLSSLKLIEDTLAREGDPIVKLEVAVTVDALALEFRILEDGRWRTIYQARSPEHRWMAQELDHDRFRSAVFRYGWSHHRVHYRQFAQAYGRRALAEFPEAEAFEARFYKYRTLSPEEARAGLDPDGRYTSSEVITR